MLLPGRYVEFPSNAIRIIKADVVGLCQGIVFNPIIRNTSTVEFAFHGFKGAERRNSQREMIQSNSVGIKAIMGRGLGRIPMKRNKCAIDVADQDARQFLKLLKSQGVHVT